MEPRLNAYVFWRLQTEVLYSAMLPAVFTVDCRRLHR